MAQTLQYYLNKGTPRPRSGRKLKNSELIGIEVELEGLPEAPYIDKWVKHSDDSLKLHGIEYTLLVWHEHALANLQNLFDNIRPSISARCSVHVHVNALDMTIENIKTFVLYYLVFERALYNYSGKRWKNIFCVPLNTWFFELNELDFDSITNWSKYSGLNLGASKLHGTLEFRQMTGNTNPMYINTWVNMIVDLKKFVMKTSYEQAVSDILTMNSTSAYWNLVSKIFKNNAAALMYNNFQSHIEKGVTHAKLNITKIVTLGDMLLAEGKI